MNGNKQYSSYNRIVRNNTTFCKTMPTWTETIIGGTIGEASLSNLFDIWKCKNLIFRHSSHDKYVGYYFFRTYRWSVNDFNAHVELFGVIVADFGDAISDINEITLQFQSII